jgi:hypothetical protein
VALLEKRRYLNNHSGDFPQVILIVPSHVPNNCANFTPAPEKNDQYSTNHSKCNTSSKPNHFYQ